MLHVLIIPYRDRALYLLACLRWLQRAAVYLPSSWTYKILICEGTQEPSWMACLQDERLIWLNHSSAMPIFNKNTLLNLGIEEAIRQDADVITFLDCDSLVGKQFFAGAPLLIDDPSVTRLCYRVRYLPRSQSTYLGIDSDRLDEYVFTGFENYDSLDLAHEGRVLPEWRQDRGEPLFGNSQWSIRTKLLGELRFDENYVGAGYEDLSMIRTVWKHFGDDYRAILAGIPPGESSMNIVQLSHERDQLDWRTKELMDVNHARYHKDVS